MACLIGQGRVLIRKLVSAQPVLLGSTPVTGRHAISFAETAAKVRRVGEAPIPRYGPDRYRLGRLRGKGGLGAFEALGHDPFGESQVLVCPQPIEVSDRDVECASDLLCLETGIS